MKKLSFLVAGAVMAAVSALAADTPLTLSGWNRDVIVEANAGSPYTTAAQPFDVPNNYAFYEAGLPGGTRGLPASRTFTSLVDGTVFGFQPYNQNNVLQLSASTTSSGILTLGTPGYYSSISILAAAANSGASQGSMVIYFADLTISPVLNFNNSDWFFQPNPAIQGFGRLNLTSTTPEDNGNSYPELYQTTINLAQLGLANKEILGFGFRDNSTDPRESTGIFAISGTMVPEPTSIALLALGTGVLLFRKRSQA